MPRVEAGVTIGGLKENVLHEYPVIAGSRASVRLLPYVAGEVEINRFPVGGGQSTYPATQVLFGARTGFQILGGIGLYAKIRPGIIAFDPNLYVPDLRRRAALDIGGVIEFYSRRHLAVRFDCGDTMVFYGNDVAIPNLAVPGTPLTVPGTRHQLQWGFGVSVWF